MKKILLTTAILLAFAIGGVAQSGSFAPQGAEWYFNLGSFMGSPISYYHMEVLGDTLIQGHQCSVISPQYGGGNGDKQYVYEDNGVVYWYNQTIQDFTTLYDFNAEVGESWICDIDSCAFEFQVQSIEEVAWADRTCRVQTVIPLVDDFYNGEVFFYGGGRIIEGIGAVGLFPNSWACFGGFVCGESPDYLRCYLVDGEMLYHEGDLECDAVLPWQYPCWDGTVAEAYDGGNGTAEDPYQIATPQQLALLAQQTNDGTGGDAYYLLTDDICLNANFEMWYHQWKPIGRVTDSTVAYFRGHFDGNGKTISKLLCETNEIMTDPVIGLFGCTDGAVIVNINLSGCRLTGGEYAGGLVGYAGRTTITGCFIESSNIGSNDGRAGGIVGYMGAPYLMTEVNDMDSCYVGSCQVAASVEVSGMRTGGIVAESNLNMPMIPCAVENCINYGSISNTTGGTSGGVGGWMINTNVTNCVNHGSVDARSWSYAGGVIGFIGRSSVRDCYNYGHVSSSNLSGGIIGLIHPLPDVAVYDTVFIVRNCHNEGEVSVREDATHGRAGGVIGNLFGAYSDRFEYYIVDCSNRGDVNCQGETAGGVIGGMHDVVSNTGFLMNVYNTGNVSANESCAGITTTEYSDIVLRNVYNSGVIEGNAENKGAIIAYQENVDGISDCYWLFNAAPSGNGAEVLLPHSCAFYPTTFYGEWSLDSLQFGHDLVEALNAGASEIESLYPGLGPVSRWKYDDEEVNGGFPVFDNTAGVLVFHGSEWYYEIQNNDGSITYQHLEQVADTTVSGKEVTIIIRTNTLYDKSEHTEVTREFVYEENNVVYWWNPTLQEFTVLYDLGAQPGDSWVIKVGMESLTMHVDAVDQYEYEGRVFKMMQVSDVDDLFSGTIVSGIGHLTSFFPERLMTRGKNYRVEGIRCYWRNGELVFKYGDKDCDEVYEEWHNGIEEDGPSTGSGTLTVYPNPVHGVLIVETCHGASLQDQTYRITNLMGQTLMTGAITTETQQIDVSNLSQGMYFIIFAGETRKFVIQ